LARAIFVVKVQTLWTNTMNLVAFHRFASVWVLIFKISSALDAELFSDASCAGPVLKTLRVPRSFHSSGTVCESRGIGYPNKQYEGSGYFSYSCSGSSYWWKDFVTSAAIRGHRMCSRGTPVFYALFRPEDAASFLSGNCTNYIDVNNGCSRENAFIKYVPPCPPPADGGPQECASEWNEDERGPWPGPGWNSCEGGWPDPCSISTTTTTTETGSTLTSMAPAADARMGRFKVKVISPLLLSVASLFRSVT